MNRPAPQHIWEGIYREFDHVHTKDDAFNGSRWITDSIEKLARLAKDEHRFYLDHPNPDGLLPLLISAHFSPKNQVRVLDFGGGVGITYAQTKRSVPRHSIQFHLVEKSAVYEAAKIFFKKEKNIRFSSSIPRDTFDIVHIKSALQYIDDWKGVLADLAACKPRFFLCVDLFAGSIPSYITSQNYYGNKIPCRFFNIKEFSSHMKKLGFEVIYKHPYTSAFFGSVGNFPQENFPKKYRLGKSVNMVFQRIRNR